MDLRAEPRISAAIVVSLPLVVALAGCIQSPPEDAGKRSFTAELLYEDGTTADLELHGPVPTPDAHGELQLLYVLDVLLGNPGPQQSRIIEYFDQAYRLVARSVDFPLCRSSECSHTPELHYGVAGAYSLFGVGLLFRASEGTNGSLMPATDLRATLDVTQSAETRLVRLSLPESLWMLGTEGAYTFGEDSVMPLRYEATGPDGGASWRATAIDYGPALAPADLFSQNDLQVRTSGAEGAWFPGSASPFWGRDYAHDDIIDAVADEEPDGCLVRYTAFANRSGGHALADRYQAQVDFGNGEKVWAYKVTVEEGLLGRTIDVQRSHLQAGIDCEALGDAPAPVLSANDVMDVRPPFPVGEPRALVVDNRYFPQLLGRSAELGWTTMGLTFEPIHTTEEAVAVGVPDQVLFDATTGELFLVAGPTA